MHDLASAPELGELAEVLSKVLDPDVQTAKQSFINKTQQCFAVRVRAARPPARLAARSHPQVALVINLPPFAAARPPRSQTGIDDLLDLCRQSFADLTEAVHECLHSIQEEHDLPSISACAITLSPGAGTTRHRTSPVSRRF